MMSVWLSGFLFFLLGLCVGSFLNVVVYRLNHGFSPLKGRSFCPKCKKKILWYDNLPLLSFVILRGRCRFCHSPISWQYPLVELATGVLTLLTVYLSLFTLKTTGLAVVYHLLVTYALITLFVSDLLYQTLPDEIIYPTLGLIFAWTLFRGDLLMALLAAVTAAAFFILLIVVTRGKGMGWGDVKLVGLMGLFLGFPGLVIALILAFLTGATTGVILVLLRKKRLGDQISFGPFLTSATWISFFWGQKIWQFYVEKLIL